MLATSAPPTAALLIAQSSHSAAPFIHEYRDEEEEPQQEVQFVLQQPDDDDQPSGPQFHHTMNPPPHLIHNTDDSIEPQTFALAAASDDEEDMQNMNHIIEATSPSVLHVISPHSSITSHSQQQQQQQQHHGHQHQQHHQLQHQQSQPESFIPAPSLQGVYQYIADSINDTLVQPMTMGMRVSMPLDSIRNVADGIRIKQPEFADELFRNLWIAAHTRYFHNQIVLAWSRFQSSSPCCTVNTCSKMVIGKTEVRWKQSENELAAYAKNDPNRTTYLSLPASEYIDRALRDNQGILSEPSITPFFGGAQQRSSAAARVSDSDFEFSSYFIPSMKEVYKYILRVYTHLYLTHSQSMPKTFDTFALPPNISSEPSAIAFPDDSSIPSAHSSQQHPMDKFNFHLSYFLHFGLIFGLVSHEQIDSLGTVMKSYIWGLHDMSEQMPQSWNKRRGPGSAYGKTMQLSPSTVQSPTYAPSSPVLQPQFHHAHQHQQQQQQQQYQLQQQQQASLHFVKKTSGSNSQSSSGSSSLAHSQSSSNSGTMGTISSSSSSGTNSNSGSAKKNRQAMVIPPSTSSSTQHPTFQLSSHPPPTHSQSQSPPRHPSHNITNPHDEIRRLQEEIERLRAMTPSQPQTSSYSSAGSSNASSHNVSPMPPTTSSYPLPTNGMPNFHTSNPASTMNNFSTAPLPITSLQSTSLQVSRPLPHIDPQLIKLKRASLIRKSIAPFVAHNLAIAKVEVDLREHRLPAGYIPSPGYGRDGYLIKFPSAVIEEPASSPMILSGADQHHHQLPAHHQTRSGKSSMKSSRASSKRQSFRSDRSPSESTDSDDEEDSPELSRAIQSTYILSPQHLMPVDSSVNVTPQSTGFNARNSKQASGHPSPQQQQYPRVSPQPHQQQQQQHQQLQQQYPVQNSSRQPQQPYQQYPQQQQHQQSQSQLHPQQYHPQHPSQQQQHQPTYNSNNIAQRQQQCTPRLCFD